MTSPVDPDRPDDPNGPSIDDALGLSRAVVEVAPYRPEWAELFAREAARLRAAMGDRLIAVEHVGSTSVPGLAAKPILDLAASVADLDQARGWIGDLRALGYEHREDPEIPERLYFVRGPAERRTHHLSLARADSAFWRGHLRFRDLLRADPALAADYARLKRRLAREHAGDRPAYSAAKHDFIEAALAGSDDLCPGERAVGRRIRRDIDRARRPGSIADRPDRANPKSSIPRSLDVPCP